MNSKVILFIILIAFGSCKRTAVNRDIVSDSSYNTGFETVNKEEDNVETPADGKLSLKAKIIRIVDGDTAELLYGELPIMLRLQHIDAPEKRGSQPYGNKARLILSELCFDQEVVIITEGDFDMGGRMIGEIINEDGLNVNKEMVRLGYAWHFKKYSSDMDYDVLEKEARSSKIGLWQDPDPIAPWDFR